MASPVVIPPQSAPVSPDDSRLFTKDWYLAMDAIAKRVNATQANGTGGFTEDNTQGSIYTIPNVEDFILNVLVSPCTVTLPDCSVGKGQILIIKNATGLSGGPVGVQTIFDQDMDGAPGLTLQIFQAVILESDGIQWHVVSIYNTTTFHVLTTAINLSVPLGSNYEVLASAGKTITLPDATMDLGRLIGIKSTDGSTITISPVLSQTIDGAASATTTSALILISDGANWFIISAGSLWVSVSPTIIKTANGVHAAGIQLSGAPTITDGLEIGAGVLQLNAQSGGGGNQIALFANSGQISALAQLTASRPMRTGSSHEPTTGQIDMGVATDIAATGLSGGQILQWSGTVVQGITGINGVIGSVTNQHSSNFITSVALSGTIPPGLTLSTTDAPAVDSVTVVVRTFTSGVLTA